MLDFLGIGAQKSGTTWLHRNLSKHPQVCFPLGKEAHFWDRQLNLGVDWYVSQFPDQPGKRSGEITPAYATLGEELIKRIYRLNPQMRLIYVLRDPRERAWSAAVMEMINKKMIYEETSSEWFLGLIHSEPSQQRGDYVGAIRRWKKYFAGGALLLLRFTDIAADPRRFLREVAQHIDIDPSYFEHEQTPLLQTKVKASPFHPIRPEIRSALNDLYAEQIRSFNRLLGETWFDEDAQQWAKAA